MPRTTTGGPRVTTPEPAEKIAAAAKQPDRDQPTAGLARVVHLDAARWHRDELHGLDALDATGWCACWTLPRPCPSRWGWSA